jgi:hypothetical protein
MPRRLERGPLLNVPQRLLAVSDRTIQAAHTIASY